MPSGLWAQSQAELNLLLSVFTITGAQGEEEGKSAGSPKEVEMKLSWNGDGQRVHGTMAIRWHRDGKGMWYGIWSVRKSKWILIIYLTSPGDYDYPDYRRKS